jgi:hypothetical protein
LSFSNTAAGRTASGIILGGDLEGEGFGVRKLRPAIEADAGDADDCELNREYVGLVASG